MFMLQLEVITHRLKHTGKGFNLFQIEFRVSHRKYSLTSMWFYKYLAPCHWFWRPGPWQLILFCIFDKRGRNGPAQAARRTFQLFLNSTWPTLLLPRRRHGVHERIPYRVIGHDGLARHLRLRCFCQFISFRQRSWLQKHRGFIRAV